MRCRTRAEVEEAIRQREEFSYPTMRGVHVTGSIGPEGLTGFLPERWRSDLTDVEYVVYSYNTPIAWVKTYGEVVIPPVRYSLTTTNHQYLTARALGRPDWHAWDKDAESKFNEVRAATGSRARGL